MSVNEYMLIIDIDKFIKKPRFEESMMGCI